MKGVRRVGVLTGGGDAPGLNAALCGVARRVQERGVELVGLRNGWQGLIDNDVVDYDFSADPHLVTRGGTVLGSSSAWPYRHPERDVPKIKKVFAELELDALIAIGGDGTLSSAERLFREEDMPVVGIPKTIDNDLSATDFTFGFFTAVERATRAMDELRTTAESHDRVIVVECMGRHAGWITAYAGVAAGAETIVVPERPVHIEELCGKLETLRKAGRRSAIIAASEGTRIFEEGKLLSSPDRDEFGGYLTGGVATTLAARVQDRIGWEARGIVLGHLQRAGDPIAFDRIFALRLGARAGRLVLEKQFGRMAALRNGEVVDVPLSEALSALKLLSEGFLDRYEDFFLPISGA